VTAAGAELLNYVAIEADGADALDDRGDVLNLHVVEVDRVVHPRWFSRRYSVRA
jgi:hypothetical protein